MTENLTLTALEVVEKYGITGIITAGPNSARDVLGWEHYAMTVRLAYWHANEGVRDIEVPWRMGTGLNVGEFTGTGDELPAKSVAQVVHSLGMDLPIREMDYPGYADEFGGWDEAGWRTYEAARDLAREVYEWCQSEEMVDDLTYCTD